MPIIIVFTLKFSASMRVFDVIGGDKEGVLVALFHDHDVVELRSSDDIARP